ncbi:MAG: hypothetical protein PVJ09_00675 [Candidatus Woesebacteria bacterium]|jgi:hypothetical protein
MIDARPPAVPSEAQEQEKKKTLSGFEWLHLPRNKEIIDFLLQNKEQIVSLAKEKIKTDYDQAKEYHQTRHTELAVKQILKLTEEMLKAEGLEPTEHQDVLDIVEICVTYHDAIMNPGEAAKGASISPEFNSYLFLKDLILRSIKDDQIEKPKVTKLDKQELISQEYGEEYQQFYFFHVDLFTRLRRAIEATAIDLDQAIHQQTIVQFSKVHPDTAKDRLAQLVCTADLAYFALSPVDETLELSLRYAIEFFDLRKKGSVAKAAEGGHKLDNLEPVIEYLEGQVKYMENYTFPDLPDLPAAVDAFSMEEFLKLWEIPVEDYREQIDELDDAQSRTLKHDLLRAAMDDLEGGWEARDESAKNPQILATIKQGKTLDRLRLVKADYYRRMAADLKKNGTESKYYAEVVAALKKIA